MCFSGLKIVFLKKLFQLRIFVNKIRRWVGKETSKQTTGIYNPTELSETHLENDELK